MSEETNTKILDELDYCHRALDAICNHLGIKVLTREEIEAAERAEYERNVKSTMEKLKDFLKEHGQSVRINVKDHIAVQLEDVIHVSFRNSPPPGYSRHSDNKEILFTGDYILTVEKRSNDREVVVIDDRWGKRIVCDTLFWIASGYWCCALEIDQFKAPTRQTIVDQLVEQHVDQKEAT